MRQTALLAPRKEGIRCSKCGAEAPCSPGDVHGGAGCPSAAHRHHAEQISMCSGRSPWCSGRGLEEVQSRSSPRLELQVIERSAGGSQGLGELLPVGTCAEVVPEGWYGVVLEQCLKSCHLWEAHVGSV